MQLSVCSDDIPTGGTGRQLGDFHVFLPAGITGLFSLGALGVCLWAIGDLGKEKDCGSVLLLFKGKRRSL